MTIQPNRYKDALFGTFLALLLGLVQPPALAAEVTGTLRQWHKVELAFSGPYHAEWDSSPTNPFLDYRLQCLINGPSGQVYDVPGFFDADGSSGESGNRWVCRFSPDEPGDWSYVASFRRGSEIAVSVDPGAGSPADFDGEGGTFTVLASDKAGHDFRSSARGRLINVGDHYLAFQGSGDRWIKGGVNVPENLLAYSGFDNTAQARHSFSAHVSDWRSGDPDWNGGAGRGIIGALNYIADTGGNAVYFLPMNIGGDGQDTFPTIAQQDKLHYDTSKLRQWEMVFSHATARGIFLHFQLAETESGNENYHDRGRLGRERKLFYRELIARFAHHPGLQWDLGEENDYGTPRRRAFAAHIKALDPYDHPLTTHTRTDQMERYYRSLLGNADFDMTGFQISVGGLRNGLSVFDWRQRSRTSGTPWVVSIDEPQWIYNDANDEGRGYPHGRRNFLWPIYMCGGGGFEWYVRQNDGSHSLDQELDDFRQMETALRWTGYALEFMNALPFWQMEPRIGAANSTRGGTTFLLAKPGDSYAVYNANGGALRVDLRNDSGTFSVSWFNPRTGEWSDGPTVQAGAWAQLGAPPFSQDAAALLARAPQSGTAGEPIASFTATPLIGDAPLEVLLDAASSFDDGAIVAYEWDLGDGMLEAGETINHVYSDPGFYPVRLSVTDDNGLSAQAIQTIEVRPPSSPDEGDSAFTLLVSDSQNRAGAASLANTTLAGNVYPFLAPEDGVLRVRYYLDDPGRSGGPRQVENVAPYDFGGGGVATAKPFDTTQLADGTHRIDAEVERTDGSVLMVSATFTVQNQGSPAESGAAERLRSYAENYREFLDRIRRQRSARIGVPRDGGVQGR